MRGDEKMIDEINLTKEKIENFLLNEILLYKTQLEVSLTWNDFVYGIKHRNRFFPTPAMQNYLTMLFDFTETTKSNNIQYRARRVKQSDISFLNISKADFPPRKSGIEGFVKKEIGSPPINMASDGRANPAGIPYLYLASNPQTACSELRPISTDMFSVSRFSLKANMKIVNLCQPKNKKYNVEEWNERYAFLICVINAFASPINEQNSIEYAPSQYISAFLQVKGIGGIRYPSYNDTKKRSNNLVIFDPNDATCLDEYGDVYTCTKKIVEFQNMSKVTDEVIRASTKSSKMDLTEIYQLRNRLNKMQKQQILQTKLEEPDANERL